MSTEDIKDPTPDPLKTLAEVKVWMMDMGEAKDAVDLYGADMTSLIERGLKSDKEMVADMRAACVKLVARRARNGGYQMNANIDDLLVLCSKAAQSTVAFEGMAKAVEALASKLYHRPPAYKAGLEVLHSVQAVFPEMVDIDAVHLFLAKVHEPRATTALTKDNVYDADEKIRSLATCLEVKIHASRETPVSLVAAVVDGYKSSTLIAPAMRRLEGALDFNPKAIPSDSRRATIIHAFIDDMGSNDHSYARVAEKWIACVRKRMEEKVLNPGTAFVHV